MEDITAALARELTPATQELSILTHLNQKAKEQLHQQSQRVQRNLIHPTSTQGETQKLPKLREWMDRMNEVEQRLLQLNAVLDELDRWSQTLERALL